MQPHSFGYPAGSDSAAIRRTILPNSRLVRWLGDRKGIEELTTTWDIVSVDRTQDWVDMLRRLVTDKRIREILAFANNHYAGHGPGTVKLFMDLWAEKK